MKDDTKTGTRYLCDILSDMRTCFKTRNFSYLPGLIEEAQYRANRMENALETYGGTYGNSLQRLEEKRIELKKEVEKLKKEKKELSE